MKPMIIIARPLHCTQASLNLQLLPGWAGWAACLPGSELLLQLKICIVQHATVPADFLYLHTYTCANACILSACQGQPGQPALLYICIYDLFFIYFTETFPAVSIHIYSRILCCLGAEYFWQDVIFNSRFFRNISSKCSKKDDDGNGDLKPCAILIGSFQALPTRTLQFQLSDMIGARMMIHNHDDDDDGHDEYIVQLKNFLLLSLSAAVH